MGKAREVLRIWGPALLLMTLIFGISSRPSASLPDLQSLDTLVKKGGHMVGYGLLALSYWRGFGYRSGRQPVAWLLAIAYAFTDEVHQSFVPGRNPSLVDVLLFDNLGAALSLIAHSHIMERQRNRNPG